MIIGDHEIVLIDDSTLKTSGELRIKRDGSGEAWLEICGHWDGASAGQGRWIAASLVPLDRVRLVRDWDKFGWHSSYERLMSLSGEQLEKALANAGPIEIARQVEEEDL